MATAKNVRREQLSYLGEIYKEFLIEKTRAREEALREADMKISNRRKELARMVWESKQRDSVTFSDIEAVTGMSRPTVYRLFQEHIDNSGGEPLSTEILVAKSKVQNRFKFDTIDKNGEIWIIDSEMPESSPEHKMKFTVDWQGRWSLEGYGYRGSKKWDDRPELEMLMENVRDGYFVPAERLSELHKDILKNMRVEVPAIKNEDTIQDDWGM